MLLLATFLKFVGGSNPIPEKILADQEEKVNNCLKSVKCLILLCFAYFPPLDLQPYN